MGQLAGLVGSCLARLVVVWSGLAVFFKPLLLPVLVGRLPLLGFRACRLQVLLSSLAACFAGCEVW